MSSGLASKVIVDTNSFIYSIKHKVDLKHLLQELPEIKGIVVPECVHSELTTLARTLKYANGALELSEKFERISGQGYADDCIIEVASREHFFVLSNDRELLKRAKEAGIRTLMIRGNREIEFV